MTTYFAKEFPGQFFSCGIAPSNMAGIGASLAMAGKTPFIVSFNVFVLNKGFEQLRTGAAYEHSNLKAVGTHSISGKDDAPQRGVEENGLARALPRNRGDHGARARRHSRPGFRCTSPLSEGRRENDHAADVATVWSTRWERTSTAALNPSDDMGPSRAPGGDSERRGDSWRSEQWRNRPATGKHSGRDE